MTAPQWPGPRGDRGGDTERNMNRFNVIYAIVAVVVFAFMAWASVRASIKHGRAQGFAIGFALRGFFQ